MQGFPAVGRFVSAIDFGNPGRFCTSSWVWLQATIGNNSVPPLLDLHLILVTESVDPIFIEYLYVFMTPYFSTIFSETILRMRLPPCFHQQIIM